MAHENFDNENELQVQAAIEAEIQLFENSNSGHTYTTMQGVTFQTNFLQQQQQFQANILQQ